MKWLNNKVHLAVGDEGGWIMEELVNILRHLILYTSIS